MLIYENTVQVAFFQDITTRISFYPLLCACLWCMALGLFPSLTSPLQGRQGGELRGSVFYRIVRLDVPSRGSCFELFDPGIGGSP